MAGIGVIFLVLLVIILYLALIAVGILEYVWSSIALMRIASRRKVKNPWMAWIPVANQMLLGNVASEYDERNGMKRNWGRILLILAIISVVGIFVAYIFLIAAMVGTTASLDFYSYDYSYSYGYNSGESVMVVFLIMAYIMLVLALMVSMALNICKAICIFKIYESTVPEKALKYLLLSLFVPLAGSLCLMKCKDKGYPYPEPPMQVPPVQVPPVQEPPIE